jgi:hypothetical protein
MAGGRAPVFTMEGETGAGPATGAGADASGVPGGAGEPAGEGGRARRGGLGEDVDEGHGSSGQDEDPDDGKSDGSPGHASPVTAGRR